MDSSSDWKETRLMVHRTLRKLSPVAAVKLIDTEHQREMNRSPSWKLIRNDEEVHICQLGSSPANSDGKYPRIKEEKIFRDVNEERMVGEKGLLFRLAKHSELIES
eukprot:TCALIF_06936-PA protein Name:"Protein of unknown function" AED:0.99 eAED:1.00 QI:0/0/0/0.16/0.8/0.83/6/0/105